MPRFASQLVAFSMIAALGLAGCQTENAYTGEQQTSDATRGAAIGALAGGVIGALTNQKQAGRNALIGAGIGALAGGAVGGYMDRQEAQLRQQLRASGVSVTRQGNNIMLNMQDDILFDLNSDVLSGRSREVIRSVGLVLKEYRQTYVNVNGYTDTLGTRAHNDRLSQGRAESVADELVRNGVDPQRITPRGYGESNLKIRTGDGVNEPRNRRVEIVLEPFTG
jgi:outer membrane protein OmpA-like peptidoglycan-associated protein